MNMKKHNTTTKMRATEKGWIVIIGRLACFCSRYSCRVYAIIVVITIIITIIGSTLKESFIIVEAPGESLASFFTPTNDHIVITSLQIDRADTTSSSTTQKRTRNSVEQTNATHEKTPAPPCQGYDGILLVLETLRGSGTGTVFFQSMLNYLIYSDTYNLYPWMHVNKTNEVCYDDVVHGGGGLSRSFSHKAGFMTDILSTQKMTCRSKRNRRPGPPNSTSFQIKNFILVGNGMWASYFDPPLPLPLDEGACTEGVPVFTFTSAQAVAGLHMCSDIALRGWPTKGLPAKLWPRKDQTMKDWLWEHRRRGAHAVAKYVRPLPWLQKRIEKANHVKDQKCLAMHVRLTDKASGREKKNYKEYLKYALIYADVTKHQYPIYLATDDARVIPAIKESLAPAVVLMQEDVVRSTSDNTPVFEILSNDKHRSNTEALVEIYAMAKCGYLVHGYSTMSEATVYISPHLHNKSVNIDDPNHLTEAELRDLLVKNTVIVGKGKQ